MGEDVADGQAPRVGARVGEPVQLGQQARRGGVEVETASLGQPQRGHGGEQLGDRSDAEHGAGVDRPALGGVAGSEALAEHEFAVHHDPDRDADQPVGRDDCRHRVADRRQLADDRAAARRVGELVRRRSADEGGGRRRGRLRGRGRRRGPGFDLRSARAAGCDEEQHAEKAGSHRGDGTMNDHRGRPREGHCARSSGALAWAVTGLGVSAKPLSSGLATALETGGCSIAACLLVSVRPRIRSADRVVTGRLRRLSVIENRAAPEDIGGQALLSILEEWPPLFGDPLMASAAMDRLLHHCQVLELDGNSFRNPPRRPRRHPGTPGRRRGLIPRMRSVDQFCRPRARFARSASITRSETRLERAISSADLEAISDPDP
jgi:hypothetical protein